MSASVDDDYNTYRNSAASAFAPFIQLLAMNPQTRRCVERMFYYAAAHAGDDDEATRLWVRGGVRWVGECVGIIHVYLIQK